MEMDEKENEHDQELQSTTDNNPLKRKLSELETSNPGSPQASVHSDTTALPTASSSGVAPAPLLVPHVSNQLPASDFEFFQTRAHPINKGNYRYNPCGPSTRSLNPASTPADPNAGGGAAEGNASGTLPSTLLIQRAVEAAPLGVRFSWEDRSPFILLTEDAKTITAEKGWRAARANVALREGSWYWEVKVPRAGGAGGRAHGGKGEGSWARIGVARRESPLNAPAGFDGHSYAYRDKDGDVITLARSKAYGAPFTSGSTLGIYLSLPPRPTPSITDRHDPARIVRKRVPIRYKGQLYFESLDYTPSKEMVELAVDPAHKAKLVVQEEKKAAPGTKARAAVLDAAEPPRELPKLAGSKLAFFLDGVCQGVAFEDLYDFLPLRLSASEREKKAKAAGTGGGAAADVALKLMENWHDDGTMGYFPFVSVFGGAIATLNPGPYFDFPPPADIETVLKNSPIPPKNPPIIFPHRKIPTHHSSSTNVDSPSTENINKMDDPNLPWRPLSSRYAESLVEQNRLDDEDELEALRLYEIARLQDESDRIRRVGIYSVSRTANSVVKKSSLVNKAGGEGGETSIVTTLAPGRLGGLGVLVKEEINLSMGGLGVTPSGGSSKASSPAPSGRASPAPVASTSSAPRVSKSVPRSSAVPQSAPPPPPRARSSHNSAWAEEVSAEEEVRKFLEMQRIAEEQEVANALARIQRLSGPGGGQEGELVKMEMVEEGAV